MSSPGAMPAWTYPVFWAIHPKAARRPGPLSVRFEARFSLA